jgi:hypothetical protein
MATEGRDRLSAISSGGDPMLKAQLMTSGEGSSRRGHMSPYDRPGVK